LNETDLKYDKKLYGEKYNKVEQFLADSKGFLMLIKTDYNKVMGFFVPSNFKGRKSEINLNALLVFYWINQNSELVTI
jgi:hypothetical protein